MKAINPEQHAFTEVSWDPKVAQFLAAALGVEQFRRIQAAIAVPPLSTCVRVNTLRTSTQDVLQQLQALLPQQHAQLQLAPHPQLPMAILLQGSGPNSIDPAAAGAARQVVISRKAGEAVLRGAHVFVPGVLAVTAGLAAGDLVAVMVALDRPGSPDSGITRGTVLPAAAAANGSSHTPAQGGSSSSSSQPAAGAGVVAAATMTEAASVQAAAAAAGTDDPAAPRSDQAGVSVAAAGGLLCIGLGRAQMGRVEMFRVQHGVAVEMTQRVYEVPSPTLDGPLKGLVMLQNLPSIVAAQVLNPQPGSRVLDMCAAPGGKTTMLAQLMQGKGQVIALDRSHAKVDDIRALAEELGCSHCVTALKMDATKAVAKQQEQQHGSSGDQAQQQQGNQQQQQESCQSQQQSTQQHHNQHADGQLLQQQEERQKQQQHCEAADSNCQDQQQQQQPLSTAGLSAKAQARLQRRIAAMAARGQAPPAAEYRLYGLGPAKHPGFAPESFDAVLLDAPCTALGLRPRLLQQHQLSLLLQTAAYQRALLAAAVQLLKPGGVLVYSTCTISPAENEVNVRHALDSYPCIQLVHAEPRLGGPGLTGPADTQAMAAAVNDFNNEAAAAAGSGASCWSSSSVAHDCRQQQWLSPAEAAMVQRFDPAGQADTIGFFVAKFVKTFSLL